MNAHCDRAAVDALLLAVVILRAGEREARRVIVRHALAEGVIEGELIAQRTFCTQTFFTHTPGKSQHFPLVLQVYPCGHCLLKRPPQLEPLSSSSVVVPSGWFGSAAEQAPASEAKTTAKNIFLCIWVSLESGMKAAVAGLKAGHAVVRLIVICDARIDGSAR